MEVWSSLRGTSCLWTKVRQCRWIGMRPSGEEERLKSCQLQPEDSRRADSGDSRSPFVSAALPFVAGEDVADGSALTGVRPLTLAVASGLLLRVLALCASPFSPRSELSATGLGVDSLFLLAADRVVGPK